MGYEREYTAEIDAVLDRIQADGAPMIATWIVQEICTQHEAAMPPTEDEFWRHCGYANTRDAVRRRINARAGNRTPTEDRQFRLPGYAHLQAYYVVKRRGVGDVGVAIDSMSDAELKAKAVLYQSFGMSSLAHSDELLDFIKKRRIARRRARKEGKAA